MKDKNHMIIPKDAEKAFDKSPAPIYDKNTQQSGNRGRISQHNKHHMQKNQHHTQLAKTKSTSLNINNKTGVSTFTMLIQHST